MLRGGTGVRERKGRDGQLWGQQRALLYARMALPFQQHTSTGTMSMRQVQKEITSAPIQKTSTPKGEKARLRAGIHSISVQLCFWLARHRQAPVPQPPWQYPVYKKQELREMAEPV